MKKKSNKKKVRKVLDMQGKPQQEKASNPKEAFDFGGLPDRNLKKNLGCG